MKFLFSLSGERDSLSASARLAIKKMRPRSERRAGQSHDSDQDQVDRHDIAEEPGRHQDQDAGDERRRRREAELTEDHRAEGEKVE